MELVCFQGIDEKSWSQINALIKRGEWRNIFVVKNKNAGNVNFGGKYEIVSVNSEGNLSNLREEIVQKLRVKLGSTLEVAVSIASGDGKEHMALISALLSIPVGIRLVAFTKKGVEYIN